MLSMNETDKSEKYQYLQNSSSIINLKKSQICYT